jgi:L,D-transpeptidase catalytic domain
MNYAISDEPMSEEEWAERYVTEHSGRITFWSHGRGYAIHGSHEINRLGGPASHGCIRLHPANAGTLFALVKQRGTLKLGSPLQRGRPVSVDPHSYMDRFPARESKDDRRSRASIGMRSRIFAMGNRRMIVAAAGLCMTAFFHRSGGDLRRSRIRSNDSNARRHDRRAV